MIPTEAVEAALNASLTFKNQRGMDNAENLMRHILEAAAPHIAAAALEEAAAELEGKRLLSKAFHLYYPEWLRERAARMVTK